MAVYTNITTYISCSSTTKEKIARINAIIEVLEDSMLENAADSGIEEYRLDDGQTQIRAVLRDIASIEKAIQALIKRRTRLVNGCVGYRYSLMDGNVKLG